MYLFWDGLRSARLTLQIESGVNMLTSLGPMIALGLSAGVLGGMFGIGGGLVMVPALVLIFGFDLKTAFGTSLFAQLLPVGLLGVREYWSRSEIQVGNGLWIAFGLFFGAWIGGRLTGLIPKEPMKQGYGLFLVLVGLYFLLSPNTPTKKPKAEQPLAAEVPETPADQVH